jgi:predicted dehydrogenase
VNCQGKAHITPGIEDVTNMSLNFGNGSFAVIQSSWIDPKKVRETVIVGTKQMVVFDDTETIEKVRIYDKRVEKPPHYDTFAEFHYSYHYGDMRSPFIKQVEPLRTECEHFVDCVSNGKTPITDGNAGLRVVRILEAAQKSLRSGGVAVELKA